MLEDHPPPHSSGCGNAGATGSATGCGEHRSVSQIIADLAGRFPSAITLDKAARRPLAIGIDRQIFEAAPDLSKTSIRRELAIYTGKRSYVDKLVAGVARVDLNGVAVGEVSAEQADYALLRLQERKRSKPPEITVSKVEPTTRPVVDWTPPPSSSSSRPSIRELKARHGQRPVIVEVKRRRVIFTVRDRFEHGR